MARQVAASQFHQSKTLNDKYLLGDEIGKGAYGRVYKGVDLENGDFVAIKQVSWENIPAEDLASIMQEIDLLKNLNHKNIVKYLGSFKTKTHLYIILEYVENGSLASIIKPNKFGAFPESLVAVYIAQVLEGLVYLHEQGVIHRDIKGANILTTKEGLVKLADFGVATKLTEADVNTHSVVGTPYWMAPEVIDMSGVSAASDIWSVGCTVIELLTCVPPYYDLQPMPALFRIVQDDHPPIPDHVSPAIIDFLHQCFRKDAKLRPDARTLLDHPWIRSRRSLPSSLPNSDGHMGSTKSAEELGNGFVPAENVNGLEAAVVLANGRPHLVDNTHVVLRQGNGEVNGVIDNTTRVRVHATRSSHRAQTRDLEPRGAVGLDKFRDTPKDAELDDLIEESSNHGSVESARGLNSWKTPSPSSRCGPEGLAAALKANMAKKFKRDATHLARKEEDELLSRIIDGADDDRADIDSLGYERESEGRDHFAKQALEVTRLIGLLRPDAPEDTLVDACQKLISIMLEAPEQKSHLIQQHGVMPLLEILEVENNRVIYAGLQVLNELVKNNIDFQENACLVGLIPVVMNFTGPEVPNDLRMQAAYFVQQLCHTSKLTLQMFIACRGLPVLVGFLETDYVKYRDMVHIAIDGMCEVFKLQTSTSRNEFCRIFAKSGVCGRLVNTLYTLNESTRLPTAGIGGIVSEKTRRQSHSGPLEKSHPSFAGYKENGKALSGQLDPSRVRFGLEDHHDQSIGMSEYSRQPTAHSTKAVAGQGDHFRPLRGHLQPLRSGQSEHGLAASSGHHHRQSREQSTHDIALRQDDVAKISSATNDVLRAANTADFLPLLSMLETESPSKAHSGQLDRARYYLGLHGKSDSTGSFLQHQLAAKRLSADFESMSVDSEPYNVSISSRGGWVGHSSAKALPVAKNMLSPDVPNGTSEIPIMSEVRSRAISGISAEVARDYISRLADLLLKFCQADSVVKAHVCSGSVLLRLFQLLGKLESPMLVKILKCIKELSMDPCTLEYLQRADAIKQLVPFLERRSGMHAVQIHTQVLNALYNLCKINKRRQEQAAECGIIPHLMHFILTNLPLKQFALPLLCDMAHASRNTREQLRAHKGLEVYLSLLDDEYWAVTALDSLAVCLAHDNEQRKVEQMLLRKEAVQKLVSFFESCNGAAFVHILEPFLKMITKSVHLTTALALSGLTPLLVGRLDHQDAIVRLNLLKLIKAVYEHHPRPKQLVVEYELAQKLQKLIEERRDGERSGGQVLVKQMATTLLKALNQNTLR